ncbi:MAG TPA: ABC transporter ATP-binding protein [Bacteroidia bacterium]|jgi:ATP-binding cassette subfamily B multidrug efflux pump|nr:ABC transporter ATP-binding protein [Bacteroidia bacterium]
MSGKKENKKHTFDWDILKRIFSFSKPYRKLFYTALFITILLAALSIARPLLIKKILDEYIAQKNVEMLTMFSGFLLAALILEALCQFSNTMLTSTLGQNIIKDIRAKLFKHILEFRNSYFDTTPVGTMVTRAVTDVEALADVFSQGFIVIMSDMLSLFVFLGAMFYVNWQLTLVVLLTVPLLLIATKFFQRGVKSTFNQVRNAVAALNTFVQEHLQGIQVVQLYNREEEEYKKFEAINEKHKEANIKAIWYYSIFFPVLEILSSLSIALVILYSGIIPQAVKVTAGDITFFIMLTGMMFRPMRMLADRINTLQMGMVAAERVFKLMDADEKLKNEGSLKQTLKGKVEFKNIWFAYNEENYILKDISFCVNPGETIAVVGATGSGKTTIINLLGRYYELSKGEILFDDIMQREFDLGFLRQQIGGVLQDVFLFSDSIKNNISLYNESITEKEIIEAAKFIGAHNFIMQLPGGYGFNVRERGNMLSAGQRQMIAFLRAYVHKPAILILDEATSSIDTETEQLIQSATEKITQGRTSFIIAHRLATIQKAKRILVMDGGKIVESGSLPELLGKDGAFKALYEQQFLAELD